MQSTHFLTRAIRIARLVLHIMTGLVIAACAWPWLKHNTKQVVIRWWCKKSLDCFNIRVITHGQLPNANTQASMFVANHVSWLDIHAMNSVLPLRFIAKSEISSWPIFGYLVKQSGTIFIDRAQRKDALRIVEITAQHLKAGENVGFFPEGTTTDGSVVLPFKSSILQAAIDAQAHIWPVAIRYPLANGQLNTQMAYAGDTSLGESIWMVLQQQNPLVELHYLAPISTAEASRQTIANTAFGAIASKLES